MPDERPDEHDREPKRSYSGSDWRQREAYENAVQRAAESEVRRALDRIGIEVGGEAGRDFAEDLAYLRRIRVRSQSDEAWQSDQAHLRRIRLRAEKDGETIRSTGISRGMGYVFYLISAGIGAAISAALAMLGAHRP